MNQRALCLVAGAFGFLCLALGPVEASAGGVAILESDSKSLQPGRVYLDATAVELADGQQISFILPSGETRTIAGPFEGTVADLTQGVSESQGLWTMVVSFMKRGMSSEDVVGGVRGLSASLEGIGGFSWTVVPSITEGNVCVGGSMRLQLARPPIAEVDRVTMADTDGGRAVVQWASGIDTADWPSDLPAANDKDYFVMVPGLPMRQITLRYIGDQTPRESEVLKALAAHGCARQIESWLLEKLGPDWRPEEATTQ